MKKIIILSLLFVFIGLYSSGQSERKLRFVTLRGDTSFIYPLQRNKPWQVFYAYEYNGDSTGILLQQSPVRDSWTNLYFNREGTLEDTLTSVEEAGTEAVIDQIGLPTNYLRVSFFVTDTVIVKELWIVQ